MTEFDKDKLDELYQLLRKANVSDDHISRGVRLTAVGERKIAERFGISVENVPDMLTALSKTLVEDAPRFTHESDYMGNITLRDSKTGESRFMQGDGAFELSDELAANPDKEQEIIASYFDAEILNEGTEEEAIVSDKGTFNFPYRGMFATAVYGLDEGGKFRCEVVSLRNSEDEEIKLSDEEKLKLHSVAMSWVEKV